MAVYRPSYRDKETGDLKESQVWWYNFTFAGRRIQESSKSRRKTVAQDAQKKRRQELERAFNDVADRRQERIQTISEVATKSWTTIDCETRSPPPSRNTRSDI